LCHTILPQRLLLGGGIGEEHFAVFAVAIRQQIARATQFSKDRVEIVKAGLGNDAGIIGAASLAFQGTNPTKTP
jgi:predicted NBD/HSP70 family sugar kinase